MKTFVGVWAVWALIGIAFWAVIGFVAWHFISKFW